MKKVFSALVLTSFFAVLLVPMMASASNCPNWLCQGEVGDPVPCTCGTAAVATIKTHYCWGGGNNGIGIVFNNKTDCESFKSGASTGVTTGGGVTSVEGLRDLIIRIGGYISMVLYAVAGVLLIVAGFFWVTAGGNPENVTKARTMLINALVGVAIALAAQGGVALIKNLTGLQ